LVEIGNSGPFKVLNSEFSQTCIIIKTKYIILEEFVFAFLLYIYGD